MQRVRNDIRGGAPVVPGVMDDEDDLSKLLHVNKTQHEQDHRYQRAVTVMWEKERGEKRGANGKNETVNSSVSGALELFATNKTQADDEYKVFKAAKAKANVEPEEAVTGSSGEVTSHPEPVTVCI